MVDFSNDVSNVNSSECSLTLRYTRAC